MSHKRANPWRNGTIRAVLWDKNARFYGTTDEFGPVSGRFLWQKMFQKCHENSHLRPKTQVAIGWRRRESNPRPETFQ